MAQRRTFMTLSLELREQIYEQVAHMHSTRRVHSRKIADIVWKHKTTASALIATNRQIHHEYEPFARRAITKLDFTVTNMDFDPVMDYFKHQINAHFLPTLQTNKATIHVDLVVNDANGFELDLSDFYAWAFFLIDTKLEEGYSSDAATWVEIYEASHLSGADPDAVVQMEGRAHEKSPLQLRAEALEFAPHRACQGFWDMVLARRMRVWGPGGRRGYARVKGKVARNMREREERERVVVMSLPAMV